MKNLKAAKSDGRWKYCISGDVCEDGGGHCCGGEGGYGGDDGGGDEFGDDRWG